MKLRNKKTGELSDTIYWSNTNNSLCVASELYHYHYDTLAELDEEWEDYEEPKEYWWIDTGSIPMVRKSNTLSVGEDIDKEMGNYFKTEEEAEQAIEKLKAWKRLRDKNFKFYGWNKGSLLEDMPNNITFACDDTRIWAWEDIQADLDLLFGEEE